MVVPSLLDLVLSADLKPSLFISMHGRANAEQKAVFARLFNLYKHYSVLNEDSEGYTVDDCAEGVKLADNAAGSNFRVEDICDRCTYLLVDDAARSRLLCEQGSHSSTREQSHAKGALRALHESEQEAINRLVEASTTTTPSLLRGRKAAAEAAESPAATRSVGNASSDQTQVGGAACDSDRLARLERDVATLRIQSTAFDSIVLANLSWGRTSKYPTCSLGLSWSSLLSGPQSLATGYLEVGGLGNLMVTGVYETWLCSKRDDELCAMTSSVAGDYMCYVYNEVKRSFEPWALNSELRLVKGPAFGGGNVFHAQVLGAIMELKEADVRTQAMLSLGQGACAGSGAGGGGGAKVAWRTATELNVTHNLWNDADITLFRIPPPLSSSRQVLLATWSDFSQDFFWYHTHSVSAHFHCDM